MKYLLILCTILLFPGCSRYVCWLQATFKQADPIKSSVQRARSYHRFTSIYDKFITVALIDALWISSAVRSVYVDMYAQRWSLNQEEREEMLHNEARLEEGTISFYVLFAPDDINNIISLTHPLAAWSIVLRVNENDYVPQEIKRVDLEPEYKLIFDKHYTRFKGSYLVVFDLFDENGQSIVDDSTSKIQLIFRTVKYETSLSWCLSHEGVYECPDCIWNGVPRVAFKDIYRTLS